VLQIVEGVYQIKLSHPSMRMGVNSYLIIEEGDVYLIDTGYEKTVDVIVDSIRHLGKKPDNIKLIINTHGHVDHAEGNNLLKQLSGAPIAIHELETQKLQFETADTIFLQDNDVLSLGNRKLIVIHTPGHCPGQICLYEQNTGIIFTGDHIVEGTSTGTVYVGPPEGSVIDYIGSLRKIQALNLTMILPGHGKTIHDPQLKIKGILEHHAQREHQILDILSSGEKTVDEIADIIYKGIATGRLAKGAVLGRIEKLIHDGLVEETLQENKRVYRVRS
jgi:glyoxylase-like metal-dependent hydrolase (beta-lactamase superfamily II)